MSERRAAYRVKKPSEHEEQAALIEWAEQMVTLGRYPVLAYLYAIPNGGKRNIVTAVRMKEEGQRAGVPDLCLPWPNGEYHGLYIELKRAGGKVSKAQRDWIDYLNASGYRAGVCYGWESARDQIIKYLELEG